MRRYLFVIALLLVFTSIIKVNAQTESSKLMANAKPSSNQFISKVNRLIITHITIVDTKHGTVITDQNVEINKGRILSISKGHSVIDKSIQIINGAGKFLIPGLWDMEVHLSWCKESSLPLLIANGVTNVRDMGGDFSEIEIWRNKINSGQMIGPCILQVGPMLNGKSFNRYQLATIDSGQVRGIVRTLKFMGVDGLEIERRVSREDFYVLMDEAKRQGLPVGGHIQISISPAEASNAGQSTIENIESLYYGTFANNLIDKDIPNAIDKFILSSASDSLFKIFARNHTAITPVLNTLRWSINQTSTAGMADPYAIYVAKSLKKEAAKAKINASDVAILKEEIPGLSRTVNKMYNDEVILLAGSDIAGARIPGFSLHWELKEFVDAGLSPMSALQTATINPAIVLGIDNNYGSVEEGKMANLVILDADPLKDIENTQKISGVIVTGKYLTRKQLNKLLKAAATSAREE